MGVPVPDAQYQLLLFLVVVASFGFSFAGASVGLVLGQLRLPLLIVLLGSPVAGAATSLAISASGALVGAVRHAREGRVVLRLLLTFGLPSGAAAFVTARWISSVDPYLVRMAIGLALIVSGVLILLRQSGPREITDQHWEPASPAAIGLEVVLGASLGALSGAIGLLLGSLRLPLMLRFLRVSTPQAVGTNMAIGCLTGVVGTVGAVTKGHIHWPAFALVSVATMLGAYLGATMTGKMSARSLQRAVGGVIIVAGLWMAGDGLTGLVAR